MSLFYRSPWCLSLLMVLFLAGCDSANEMEPESNCDRVGQAVQIAKRSGTVRLSLAGTLSVITQPNAIHSDVWGYVDSETCTEYALIGSLGNGQVDLHIIDATDPTNLVEVALVGVPGFDMKVWKQYVYTVTGGGDSGNEFQGRIVDLTDPANPVIAGSFPSSHNLFIDDQGFMYLESPGLRIMDLNPDPLNPVLVWQSGIEGGHDATVIGDRLYDFHGGPGTFLYDVSTRSAPQLLGSITLDSIRYHHSGWTTTDGNYLFICDEGSQGTSADVTVWDIQDPSDPVLVAEIADDNATVHNLFIVGDLAYVSYYTAGFRIYDVSDPTQPLLVEEFDTEPAVNTSGFAGAWGVYPFTPSGAIYVSDTRNGLHVFSLEP